MRPETAVLRAPIALFLLAFLLAPAERAAAQAAQSTARATASAAGAAKKPLTIEDYSRWRTIQDEEISGDGRWVVYVLRHTNVDSDDSKPVLHIVDLDTDEEVEIAAAHSPTFSPDSRWVLYQVDSVATRRGRGRRGAEAQDTAAQDTAAVQDSTRARQREAGPPRLVLRELSTGEVRSWERMQSGTFNRTSTHLLLRRRSGGSGGGRGGRGGGRGGGGGDAGSSGTDMVLHDLAANRSIFLGSVGEASFNRQGDLLGYTVDASPRDGNGLFIYDLARARTHVLDNDARTYARLEWSDDGDALAVLKGREVEDMRERENVLLVVTDLRESLEDSRFEPITLDQDAPGLPDGFVVSERASLSWSEDASRVFFGIIPQTEAPDTARRPATDSVPNVNIWRTEDKVIQSVQMRRANAQRNFTFQQAFELESRRFIALTDSMMRELDLSADGRWAVGRDERAYISDYEPSRADFYRVDTRTGERTLMLEAQLTSHVPGFSPDGRHYLYWKDGQYNTYEVESGVSKPIPNPDGVSFVDAEYDHPGPRPPYGITGYTKDGKGVVVEHRYDLWLLPLDGGGEPRNLTNGVGTQREVRFRYVRTEPVDPDAPRRLRTGNVIDLSEPVTLSAYGEYTKKDGFYRLDDGRLDELVFDDAIFSGPRRAEHADRFLFTRQTFVEYPDLRVSGPDFRNAKQISDANPQRSEYMWGRRVLFDYQTSDGVRLQGILALPDDYVEGERRPMLVSFYEKNSQNLHRYPTPSFLTGMGSIPTEALSRGYITMLADVHFRTGSSHSDMLEAVEAATRKVIAMGYADPDRIGVHGHSYGGEGAAFIGTRSKMFAAVGVGAGVTDLYSDFSQNWGWSYQVNGGSGANGSAYYLYGQGRWGTSPWDDPELFRSESALANAPNAVAPILIMHGTDDPTVAFSEGLNLYNALRYNKKTAILLAYPGEGHGLRGLANRRDLTVRYFEFFDHYLKGEPAPEWMTEGVPYLVKQANGGGE